MVARSITLKHSAEQELRQAFGFAKVCIREHLNRDRASHIFQHLQQSEACRNSCSAECSKVIDRATTKFQVKIKEALHISWEQPSLNKQLYHVNLTLSF